MKRMTTAEAADYLGCRPTTVSNWRQSGAGPTFLKLGGKVRYDPVDLDAWVASRRRTSTLQKAAS